MDSAELWKLTEGLPQEWWSRYGSAHDLVRLIETLHQRRSAIRDLIEGFRNSSRSPFPNWTA